MGLLFSKLVEESNVNNNNYDPNLESMIEYSDSASSFVTKEYLASEEEFNQILLENMQAAYIAEKAQCPEIVTEGLTDMVQSIIRWLKNWIIKIKDFIVTMLKKIYDFFNKGSNTADKYLKNPRPFKSFEANLYKYTFPQNEDLNGECLAYIDQVTAAALDISKSDINALYVNTNKYIDKYTGEFHLAQLRGKLTNNGTVESKDFQKVLKRYFRDNQDSRQTMTIDQQWVMGASVAYRGFEEILKATEKDRTRLDNNTQAMMTFINREPNFYSEYLKGVLRSQNKVVPNNSDVITKHDAELSRYFTHINLAIKQRTLVYDKYFAVKLDALKEAIHEYGKVIFKAYTLSRVEMAK